MRAGERFLFLIVVCFCFIILFVRMQRFSSSFDMSTCKTVRVQLAAVGDDVCPESRDSALLVIYNRLPKCGSTSTSELLSSLAMRNKFQIEFSADYNFALKDRLNDPTLVHALQTSAAGKPSLYVNHVEYFGDVYDISPESPRPEYIQIVREPISRVISQYNYLTNPERPSKVIQLKEEAGFDGGDLDACVLKATNPQYCEKSNLMTLYFCGYARECADPSSSEALETAVTNLGKYVFVGIMEDLDSTYRMFEKLLPTYFDGASLKAVPHAKEGLSKKKGASDHTLEFLRSVNANDVALYDLIVEKFQKQVHACLNVTYLPS